MTRTLILNGGATISDDLLSASVPMDDPVGFFGRRGLNSGDILVYDSILGQTVHDEIENLQFRNAADPEKWPKGKFDQVIIRGSNYLGTKSDLTGIAALLEKLDCPVVAIGVGAQAAKPQKIKFNAGTIRFWQAVSDHSTSLGVRGVFSAEVFESIGVKNLKLIGCPSFYRCKEPELRINKAKETPRLGINLNQWLGGNYCSNAEYSNRFQRALIKQAANRPDSFVYGQGEVQESIANHLPAPQQTEALLKILTKFELPKSGPAMQMYRDRLVCFYNIPDWQTHIRQNIDFMVGFRLHGCAIALAQSIPAILFTYDTRSREMATLFQIPSIEIDDFKPFSLDKIMANADFSKFETAYRDNFITYRDFLDENNVAHRLSKTKTEPTENGALMFDQNLVDSGHSVTHNYQWLQREMNQLSQKHIKLRSQHWYLKKNT